MKIRDFGLEIFFGRYEFSAPYLLAQSDCESLSIRELLALEPGAQEDFLDTWLGYSENDGAPALREAVSGLYTQCGPGAGRACDLPVPHLPVPVRGGAGRGLRALPLAPASGRGRLVLRP